MYEAIDGEVFATEAEAKARDEEVRREGLISAYLAALPENVRENDRAVARRANVVREFLVWQAGRVEAAWTVTEGEG